MRIAVGVVRTPEGGDTIVVVVVFAAVGVMGIVKVRDTGGSPIGSLGIAATTMTESELGWRFSDVDTSIDAFGAISANW